MKIDLHRLRHAATVAHLRSFSRAAESLAITQPALSRSIATLEEDLGLRIFDRGRAGVFVTPAGAELLSGAQRLLAQAEALEHAVSQIRNAASGVVRFGMAPLVASIYLTRLLAALAAAHPGLVLRPLVRKAEELLGALTGGEIESGFVAGPHLPRQEHVSFSIMGSLPVGIFARAAHPLVQRASVSANMLRDFPFAASVPELPGGNEPPLTASIVCDNYFLMRELMLSSDTACLMSPLLLREELRAGQVAPLNTGFFPPVNFELCAVRRRGRTLSPAGRLLRESLSAIMRGEGGTAKP